MNLFYIGFICIVFITISDANAKSENQLISNNHFQTTLSSLNLSGSIRAGYWNGSRNLDDRSNLNVGSIWVKAEPNLGDVGNLVLDARYGDSDLSGDGKSGIIREFYFESSWENLDFSFGRKLLIWGKADRLNPTDNLTPRDYTLLVPDDTDQRFGAYIAQAAYYFDTLSLTTIFLPRFEPSIVPVTTRTGVRYEDEIDSHQDSWAVRLDQYGETVDWSLSYFDGFNNNLDIGIAQINPGDLVLIRRHLPIQVIGIDIATTIGHYGFRAEAAYNRTEDMAGNNPYIANPFLYLVAGADRTFSDYLNINLQLFIRHVNNFEDPSHIGDPLEREVAIREAIASSQLDRNTYGITGRIADKWFNATLGAQISFVYSLPRRDYVIRAKSSYDFTDRWSIVIGADWFRGDTPSFYGYLRSNSLAFAEIKYAF